MVSHDRQTGSLEGRCALVTGGGRGIGRAIAGALTKAGANVTITGRDAGVLDAAIAAGAARRGLVADVTDPAALDTMLRDAERDGALHILVANAGAAVSAPLARSDDELFRRMIDVNLMGVVRCTRALARGMAERGEGRIVAVASTAGLKGYPYVSAYAAAKHAVIGFVRSTALELARTGVTVNAVCPGFTETDLTAETLDRIEAKTGRSREAALGELTRHNPQGRLVQPDEVADAVLWLCGPAARSVTGQAIVVAGGEV